MQNKENLGKPEMIYLTAEIAKELRFHQDGCMCYFCDKIRRQNKRIKEMRRGA